jgi:DNA-binding response OmpR family regulator
MSRVLLWVAHEPLREIIAEVLRDEGHAVAPAASRREALAALGSAAGGHGERPDLVLVDADEDGAIIARSRERLPGVPIVALSSTLAMHPSGDVDLAMPFRIRDLLDVIDVALRRGGQPAPHAPHAS